jgi:FtsH-binding integral membrane protein
MSKRDIGFGRSSGASCVASYLSKVYGYMGLGVLLTGAVAFFGASVSGIREFLTSPGIMIVAALAPLGVVLYLSTSIMKIPAAKAQMWFWIYSSLIGISMVPILMSFTPSSIANAFFASASTFGAMSIYGYVTKKDLSPWGSFLYMGIWGIIISSVVNMFIGGSAFSLAISAASILVFSGLTAYDVQMIKNLYYRYGGEGEVAEKIAIYGALSLYIDLLNLFYAFLNFFGERR